MTKGDEVKVTGGQRHISHWRPNRQDSTFEQCIDDLDNLRLDPSKVKEPPPTSHHITPVAPTKDKKTLALPYGFDSTPPNEH